MKAVRRGFIKSIPILCSYLFVGMAYGITMQNDGFLWHFSVKLHGFLQRLSVACLGSFCPRS